MNTPTMETPTTTTSTRAAVITRFGGTDVFDIAELTVPDAGLGQVRIRVAHSAVNPIDLGTREGRIVPPDQARFPMVLGWDADGVIEQVGPGVERLAPGDHVYVCTQQPVTQAGTHADLIVVDADSVAPAPTGDAGVGGRAAALGLAGITAYQAVEALGVAAGQTVLVNNPVGFIGSLAVQIVKARGATVVGTVADELAGRAAATGTDHVVTTGPVTGDRVGQTVPVRVRQLVPGGVDAALDLVGGVSAQRTFATVRDGGRYATVLPEWWIGGGVYEPARGITPVVVENDPNWRDLTALADLASRGLLRVEIARTFGLDELGKVHDILAGTGVLGKIIIKQ